MTEHVGGQWMKLGLRFGCDWGFEVYFFHVEASRSCTGEQISPWHTKSEWLSGIFTSDEERKLLLETEDIYHQSNQLNTGCCRALAYTCCKRLKSKTQKFKKTPHFPALVLSFPSQIDKAITLQNFWKMKFQQLLYAAIWGFYYTICLFIWIPITFYWMHNYKLPGAAQRHIYAS